MRKPRVAIYCVMLLVISSMALAEYEPGNEAAFAWDSALVAIKANKLSESEVHLKRTLIMEPEWAEAHFELGDIYFRLEKYELAAGEFKSATSLNSEHAEWYKLLGNAYATQGKCAEASGALNRALEMDTSLIDCYQMLAACYFNDKDYANARVQYAKYIVAKPGDSKALYQLAESNKKLKKTGAAIKAYKKAIKADPKMFAAHNHLGNLYLENQDFGKAENALNGAVKLRPKHSGALFNLAIAIHSQSRLKDALAAYEKVVSTGGKSRKAKANVKLANQTIKGLKEQIAAGAN